MQLARRLVIAVAAAICLAWLRSPTRRTLRAIAAWRTAMQLEECDADALALRALRDKTIPRAFLVLREEKLRLIAQFEKYSDGATPVAAPLPDPLPRAAAPGPWSPNQQRKVGPLFHTQRTRQ